MPKPMKYALILIIMASIMGGLFHFTKKYFTNRSQIIISDHMIDFIDAVNSLNIKDKNLLVAIDVDDTLYQSAKLLGTPNWFYSMVNALRQNGIAKKEAYHLLSKIDYSVQEYIAIKSVENALLVALDDWQKRGIKVIALTSRASNFATFIDKQLKFLSVNFSHPVFDCVSRYWDEQNGQLINGVLYVGFQARKATAFEHLLKNLNRCHAELNTIAFVDDQQRYVLQIEKLAKKNSLGFVGAIYGNAVNARNFDLNKANRQLAKLESRIGKKIVPSDVRTIFALERF